MISKWFHLKSEAISLRKRGKSIRYVSSSLGIPLSTLSYWFKNIKLTKQQYEVLKKKHEMALVHARKEAVVWHNTQKAERLKKAETEADITLSKINIKNKEIIELSLALLYLGEGSKKSITTGMGNSDPIILKFFLKIMTQIYSINIEKIRFDLHLRADQNVKLMKEYWAKELNISVDKFRYIALDQRTAGRKTYPHYKGVCLIDCSNVAVQRKLVYIARKFCEKTIKNLGG